MMNAKELPDLPKLGKDDTFIFGCNRCGKCCREREDVLLTPLDLFKIAKYLNMTIQEVIKKYCESYEGADSKVPIVRIKPKEYRRTCPFSTGKCLIHPVKPAVCALYPLGRMTNGETKEFTYFLQPTTCGNNNQTQTVRQWLDDFSILDEEIFNILWHQKIMEIAKVVRTIYEATETNHETIFLMLLMNLYVIYNLEIDFMPQFIENSNIALEMLTKMVDEIVVVD